MIVNWFDIARVVVNITGTPLPCPTLLCLEHVHRRLALKWVFWKSEATDDKGVRTASFLELLIYINEEGAPSFQVVDWCGVLDPTDITGRCSAAEWLSEFAKYNREWFVEEPNTPTVEAVQSLYTGRYPLLMWGYLFD